MNLGTNLELTSYTVEVIFIPEYIVSAMKSRNTNLAEFEAMIRQPLHRTVSYDRMSDDGYIGTSDIADPKLSNQPVSDLYVFKQYLETKLSKVDIADLYIFNNWFNLKMGFGQIDYRSFITRTLDDFYPLFKIELDPSDVNKEINSATIHKSLETLYDNTMRITDNIKSLPFDTQVGTDSLFVILKYGFTNYILDNDVNQKVVIFSKLLDILVSSFGEDRVVNSVIFNKYLKLIKSVSLVS